MVDAVNFIFPGTKDAIASRKDHFQNAEPLGTCSIADTMLRGTKSIGKPRDLSRQQFLAGGGVPETKRFVPSAAVEYAAIAIETYINDYARVPLQRSDLLPVGNVPQMDAVILTRSREPMPFGMPKDGSYTAGMLKGLNHNPTGPIPHANDRLRVTGSQ